MQNIRIIHIISLLAVMAVVHFVANAVGIYDQNIIWIDKLLHIAAGVGVAMLWFWILKNKLSSNYTASSIEVMAAIGFVLLIAFFWEVLEFSFWKFFPGYALKTNLFSSSVFDVLGDIAADVVGGILYLFLVKRVTTPSHSTLS